MPDSDRTLDELYSRVDALFPVPTGDHARDAEATIRAFERMGPRELIEVRELLVSLFDRDLARRASP